ncbi:unnamed protein product [Anisakis simplex]|uniref:HMG box transcription factor BBX (inferred by orthology to a human protein) n=1 Tax=Anisakis simplex TaxID=6269 RepID=A0A0M3J4F6_ANISI|nr:unnamed protein product [Anisakis simplex]
MQSCMQKRFILMPTPAQRGLAKGQQRRRSMNNINNNYDDINNNSTNMDVNNEKRNTIEESAHNREQLCENEAFASVKLPKLFKRNDDHMDRVLNELDFDKKFASLPAFTPDDPHKGTTSLPSTPSAVLRTILEKQKNVVCNSDNCYESDSSHYAYFDYYSPMLTPHTPKMTPDGMAAAEQKRESSNSSTSSSFFFGPNFNLAALHDNTVKVNDSSNTSMSQNQDTYYDIAAKTSYDNSNNNNCNEKSSSRKLLDHRRQLVVELLEQYGMFPSGQATASFQDKHRQFFPNKQTLTMKIREVRQKMMATMHSPLTPSGGMSFGLFHNRSDRLHSLHNI